jgi:hypothetical protein
MGTVTDSLRRVGTARVQAFSTTSVMDLLCALVERCIVVEPKLCSEMPQAAKRCLDGAPCSLGMWCAGWHACLWTPRPRTPALRCQRHRGCCFGGAAVYLRQQQVPHRRTDLLLSVPGRFARHELVGGTCECHRAALPSLQSMGWCSVEYTWRDDGYLGGVRDHSQGRTFGAERGFTHSGCSATMPGCVADRVLHNPPYQKRMQRGATCNGYRRVEWYPACFAAPLWSVAVPQGVCVWLRCAHRR